MCSQTFNQADDEMYLQDQSIFTEDSSRRGDITEDRDESKDSSGVTSFATAPSTIVRTNLAADDESNDLRLRKEGSKQGFNFHIN